MKRRGYSHDYPMPKGRRGIRYMLDGIPPVLWTRVVLRARRQGISVRTLLLGLLDRWLTEKEE